MTRPLDRRTLPLADWPVQDRRAWTRSTGLSSGAAPQAAARWSVRTRGGVQASYGRWLRWLGDNDAPSLAERPGTRTSQEAVAAYAAALGTSLAPISVAAALLDISRAMKVISPGTGMPWLTRLHARMCREARPTRGKEERLVPSTELLRLGLKLISSASEDALASSVARATLHRDGLMIALLALRPLRCGNFLAMPISRHVVRRGADVWIYFDADETKTRRPLAFPFPAVLLTHLARYIAYARPILAGCGDQARNGKNAVRRTQLLWLSRSGSRVSQNAFYSMTRKRTDTEFSKAVNPNLFRDCLATSLAALEDDVSWTIPHLLGHRSASTSETFYNHVRGVRALERFQKHVDAIREPLKRR